MPASPGEAAEPGEQRAAIAPRHVVDRATRINEVERARAGRSGKAAHTHLHANTTVLREMLGLRSPSSATSTPTTSRPCCGEGRRCRVLRRSPDPEHAGPQWPVSSVASRQVDGRVPQMNRSGVFPYSRPTGSGGRSTIARRPASPSARQSRGHPSPREPPEGCKRPVRSRTRGDEDDDAERPPLGYTPHPALWGHAGRAPMRANTRTTISTVDNMVHLPCV